MAKKKIHRGNTSEKFKKINIIETMAEALVATDVNGQIEFANTAAQEMLRYSLAELKGKGVSLIMLEQISLEDYTRLDSAGKAWQGVWRTKEGKEVPVLCNFTQTRNRKGDITGLIYFAKDISALKITEEELLDAQLALKKTQDELIQSEKMAAVGRIAGGIAHEIRNPLAIISQGLYLIDSMLKEKDAQFKKTIENVKSSVIRVNAIIDHLLSFVQASRLNMNTENICEVIDSGISLLETQQQFANIQIKRCYPSEPLYVEADKITLAQVFFNIVANAADAMESSGTIMISVSQAQDKCAVEFKDTGKGISKKDLAKIFEPFFTTKRPGKGIGLGLAMVYLIVNRHRGVVKVASEVNKGTTFTITLPLVK